MTSLVSALSNRTMTSLTSCSHAQAALTDSLQFGFAIAATNFSATPTQSALNGATGANNATTAATCATLCPLGLKDIVCHMKHKCWSSLLVFAMVMLAILVTGKPHMQRSSCSHDAQKHEHILCPAMNAACCTLCISKHTSPKLFS